MRTKLQTYLAPDEVAYHVEAVALQMPGKCGASLKALRENANKTQREVGHAFHRSHGAVAQWEAEKSWPPKNLTGRVLQFLNVPSEILAELVTLTVHSELDATIYATGDPVEIEFKYFLNRRGRVLEALTNRAEEGSDFAVKLFMDWMRENENTHSARVNYPRIVNENASHWTQKSISETRSKHAPRPSESVVIPSEPASQPTDNT